MLYLVKENHEYTVQAYTTTKGEGTSEKYRLINSLDIYKRLENLGFYVESSRAKKANIHARHITVFRANTPAVNGCFFRAIVDNSHNGTGAMFIRIGLYRVVCSNGLVLGKDILQPYRITHMGNIEEKMKGLDQYLVEAVDVIGRMMGLMVNITLTAEKYTEFLKDAWLLRYSSLDGFYDFAARAKRFEDEGNTLWAVYNRVQEYLMKGVKKRSRAINSDVRSVDFNAALSDIAMKYAV